MGQCHNHNTKGHSNFLKYSSSDLINNCLMFNQQFVKIKHMFTKQSNREYAER